MKKLIIVLVAAVMLQGCFLDSLWSTDDDEYDKPVIHYAPEPNPPVLYQ